MVDISLRPPMPCGLELEAWSLRLGINKRVALNEGRRLVDERLCDV